MLWLPALQSHHYLLVLASVSPYAKGETSLKDPNGPSCSEMPLTALPPGQPEEAILGWVLRGCSEGFRRKDS